MRRDRITLAGIMMIVCLWAQRSAVAESLTASTETTLQSGYVLRNGKLLNRPYVVSIDEQGLTLNGQPYKLQLYSCAEFGVTSRMVREDPQLSRTIVEQQLDRGGMALCFHKGELQILVPEDAQYALSLLLSDHDAEFKRQRLSMLPLAADVEEWDGIIDRFAATTALQAEWAAQQDAIAGGIVAYSAIRRILDRCQIVAEWIGLALLGLAPVILLKWQPSRLRGWGEMDALRSPVVTRCVPLIVALCALDLWCTLLAGHSGIFWEANPLGRTLLEQPVLLIAFKALTTCLGVGLLWRLRQFRGAQVAAWSLCLVLTMLAVRWQTFNWQYLA